jgi:DNA repair protein RadA/Sms
MAKARTRYVCSECGGVSPKWLGQCPACQAWNTLVEGVEPEQRAPARNRYAGLAPTQDVQMLGEVAAEELDRMPTGVDEFDRALGGGLVEGSVVLIGGDPGIGKLLQSLAHLSASRDVLYVSGEESAAQVALRARRLGLEVARLPLLAEISLERICASIEARRPAVVVVDSIQTLYSEQLQSAPGSVAQVRECAAQLTRLSKQTGVSVVMIGHVTKEGTLAGPRVLEHMVDTVLYFEGERGHQFRILRSVKNRFGPADEIGVFEMTGMGLAEVTNPSALFLSDRETPAPGSVVFAGIEGTRPVLVEIQALVAPSSLSQPRRAVVGWDGGRLSMILAVLEARAGISFAGLDVYLNIAGGMRISEPAADLAVAAALLSAREDAAIPHDCVVFGEVSLSGALRPVSQAENRLKEAAKLGFSSAIAPAGCKFGADSGVRMQAMTDLPGFVGEIFGAG